MAILEQLQAVVDFIVDGKIAASQPTFQPSEAADAMDEVNSALQVGLTAKHIKSGAFRMLSLTAWMDQAKTQTSGCTLGGALEGDVVAGVLKSSDFSDAADLFESVVTVEGEIQQSSLTDLSASTFIVLLIAA